MDLVERELVEVAAVPLEVYVLSSLYPVGMVFADFRSFHFPPDFAMFSIAKVIQAITPKSKNPRQP
jgi:hypothetical protein